MRVVNQFSAYKESGDVAERFILEIYFPRIGLRFEKLPRRESTPTPEGYVLDNGTRKALIEVKLCTYNKRLIGAGFQRLNINKKIYDKIKDAKKQLQSITERHTFPKIVYIVADDGFVNPRNLACGIFGPVITIFPECITGHESFFSKWYLRNQFHDNFLSAIVCYVPTVNGYKLWVYTNELSNKIPEQLLDKNHIEELWIYNSKNLEALLMRNI